MSWLQLVKCDIKKMGTRKGWCLANVRLAFEGQPMKWGSAKEAMLENKNAGTLHDISTLPTNVSVPVFVDSPSKYDPNNYEHIEISDKGTFYSDGKYLTQPMNQKFFGWGEILNGVRIVKWVEDKKEEPKTEPKPEPQPVKAEGFKVGDVVVPTRLVDYTGTRLIQYDPRYIITQINGDRAVLSARGAIWSAMNVKDIRKA